MISVVICTRDRVEKLKECLVYLTESSRDFRDEWEVIIVDNGSTTELSHELARIQQEATFPLKIA